MAREKIKIAVADSSFLIGLCMINQIELLGKIVNTLYIAPAVWHEVVEKGRGRYGSIEVSKTNCIKIYTKIQNNKSVEMLKIFLGDGEAETLVLAQEIKADVTFLDETKARTAALSSGLKIMGLGAFLILCKKLKLIETVKPLFDKLDECNFRLSRQLKNKFLQSAGELNTF